MKIISLLLRIPAFLLVAGGSGIALMGEPTFSSPARFFGPIIPFNAYSPLVAGLVIGCLVFIPKPLPFVLPAASVAVGVGLWRVSGIDLPYIIWADPRMAPHMGILAPLSAVVAMFGVFLAHAASVPGKVARDRRRRGIDAKAPRTPVMPVLLSAAIAGAIGVAATAIVAPHGLDFVLLNGLACIGLAALAVAWSLRIPAGRRRSRGKRALASDGSAGPHFALR
ncbi:MAG: hypothetical protein ACYDDF_14780 [Thermoplasmatota archaeon]